MFRWEEKMTEERARSKELVSRLEREKHLELENMDYKNQVLQKEVQSLRKDKERQDSTIDNLQNQMAKLQDDLEDSKSLAEQLEKEKRDLRSEFERLVLNFGFLYTFVCLVSAMMPLQTFTSVMSSWTH